MFTNRKLIFLGLFFISGACGLIYEIVWSRLLVFVFGGTTFAITTVLTCFMGGLALGSFLAGHYSQLINRPRLAYGILEICIGIYCLFIPLLFDYTLPIYRILIRLSGESFQVLTIARVLVCVMILIIPTTCMGATLPILTKSFVTRKSEIGSNVARLYGVNTIGAFIGATGTGFLLLPSLGLQNSIWVAAILNIVAGTAAILLSLRVTEKNSSTPKRPNEYVKPSTTEHEIPLKKNVLLVLYGLSGFMAMAFQVAWTRALILSLGSSTYAFSAIVACYIFGLAIGSLIISVWVDKIQSPLYIAGLLEYVIGLSALVVVPLFGEMPEIVRAISTATNASFGNILFIEVLSVFGLLIIPTLSMGALLPLMCRLYDSHSYFAGKSVGNVYAANTVGAIIGALVAGFVLIPSEYVGMQNTILLASMLGAVIGTVFILKELKSGRLIKYALVTGVWILGIVVGSSVKPWSKRIMVSGPYLSGGEENFDVLYYREGIDATVAVTTPRGSTLRALRINGKPDATNEWGDMVTQSLLAQIPLLLKPDSKVICNIGLGAGITAGSALAYPITRIDAVEISAAVLEAAAYFEDSNNNTLSDSRVKVHLADARNFLLLTDNKYDLIISEPSNPWMSGIANLYTREFFEIARNRLNPGGMHCQWIHSYSIKVDDFAAIIKTLSDVFQYVQLWELMSTDFLILGSDEPISIDVESLYHSFSRAPVAKILSSININDPMQMANYYVADGSQLKDWLGDRKIFKDDLPHLEFSAPRFLLRNEHNDIIQTLINIEGFPIIKGNRASSLMEEFIDRVVTARKKRKSLHKARISAAEKNLSTTFKNFIEAALYGSTDARTALFLAKEFINFNSALTSNTNRTQLQNTYRVVSGIILDFDQFQNVIIGNPARFYWPFTKDIRTDSHPEVQNLTERANHLTEAVDKREIFDEVGDMLKAAPQDPAVLTLMGKLALEIEGPEKAIPYLLKALILSPNDKGINFHVARAYGARGDHNTTLHFLKTAIEKGYNDYQNITSEPMFDSLRYEKQYLQIIDRINS